MTTTTKNTQSIQQMIADHQQSTEGGLGEGKFIRHDGYTLADGNKRGYVPVNGIYCVETGVTYHFPSCFNARNTTDWERMFEQNKAMLLKVTVEQSISLEQALLVALALKMKYIESTVWDAFDFDTYFSKYFASHLVMLWATCDAFYFLKHGSVLEEGSQQGMSMKPVSGDVFGTGGRVFASDLWDFIMDMRERVVAESLAEQKSRKPQSKASKKKSARKINRKK
jgi:hypothetical protein